MPWGSIDQRSASHARASEREEEKKDEKSNRREQGEEVGALGPGGWRRRGPLGLGLGLFGFEFGVLGFRVIFGPLFPLHCVLFCCFLCLQKVLPSAPTVFVNTFLSRLRLVDGVRDDSDDADQAKHAPDALQTRALAKVLLRNDASAL